MVFLKITGLGKVALGVQAVSLLVSKRDKDFKMAGSSFWKAEMGCNMGQSAIGHSFPNISSFVSNLSTTLLANNAFYDSKNLYTFQMLAFIYLFIHTVLCLENTSSSTLCIKSYLPIKAKFNDKFFHKVLADLPSILYWDKCCSPG